MHWNLNNTKDTIKMSDSRLKNQIIRSDILKILNLLTVI